MPSEDFDIVVLTSGGKDSQACLKLAVGTYGPSRVVGLFCDTKFEHPKTYAHVASLERLYGSPIITINNGSVVEQVRKYQRFPTGLARFCTYNLKITAGRDWYLKEARRMGHGFEVWIGVRAGESSNRKRRYAGRVGEEVMPLHEFMPKNYPKQLEGLGVLARLPIVEWSEQDVFEFLDGQQNVLYSEGFSRVGCFPCLAAGDAYKLKSFKHDDTGKAHYAQVVQLEAETGKSVFTSKKHQTTCEAEFAGCAICAI